MSRPLRLQFSGALYHVTSRGDRKAAIYLDHIDRLTWLSILAEVCLRCNFIVHGFCQMTNHYHLIVETMDGNLAQGMQQLNALYSQYFNRRHGLVGHVFQGRYKGILAQRETYMLELTRYVVLNPVRAGFVALPEEWPWSSYLYFIGQQPAPAWLDIRSTLTKFATEPVAAANAYRQFVISGIGKPSPLLKVKYQLVLGDEQFISELQRQAPGGSHRAVAKVQRRATCRTLEEYLHEFGERDEAMAQAYHSTAYTMEQIGNYFGVSAKTVSRAAKKFQLN